MREPPLCLGINTSWCPLYMCLRASTPVSFPLPGPPGDASMHYLVVIPFTSMSVMVQEAGLLGELIAEHMDQEKASGIR